jgi:hypothetical protein
MTDIVERLREHDLPAHAARRLCVEAADEIERLRLELAEAARYMDAQDEELKRLRMLEFELRSDIALAPLSPKGKSDD